MGNAVLSLNADTCYKNEDATEGIIVQQELHKAGDPAHVRGNEVLTELKEAKRGFMFARKFKSEDSGSMASSMELDLIQRELDQI
jgi:DNA-binding transcriptional regulator YdaS (Cro superfamily)